MTSEELAKQVRRDCVEMVHNSHASHIASALSVADVLAVLYKRILNVDPKDPAKEDRDILIMSKGHAGIAVYATLAESGFFPRDDLKTYYQNDSLLSGHVSHKVTGVEFSSGSLGHGLPVACGYALAKKIKRDPNKVYVICGDGELEEGSNWEAIMNAPRLRLANLVLIIDRNHMQAMGDCKDIVDLNPLGQKFTCFGWDVIDIKDGNNHQELFKSFQAIKVKQDKPVCVIANTVKGKGVSFMENTLLWHYRDPQGEFYDKAMEELAD